MFVGGGIHSDIKPPTLTPGGDPAEAMAEIARITLDFEDGPAQAWDAAAAAAAGWLSQQGLAARDAIVLVPLAQHLAPARRAFGRLGGWLPRVETTRTLAASLPPALPQPEGAVSFDTAQDRLRARQMLREQEWGDAWARRDPKAFEHTLARLVDCAHQLARRAGAIAPDARSEWEGRARALLSAGEGPGHVERMLARIALEWVCASAPWPSDRLHALRPAAWIAVQAGGPDPLAQGVLESAAASVPALLLQADTLADDPLTAVPAATRIREAACIDFEDEAERTAAQLLALLDQGRQPLVLVAQDRLLVRRVGALLARHEVPVLDETGWKLSTTRAAAGVMALLRAAAPAASTDEVLDWLKVLPGGGAAPPVHALDGLEQALRRAGCTRRDAMAAATLPEWADAARQWTLQRLAPLADSGRATWAQWTDRLRQVLVDSGQWPALESDIAGAQVLRALRLLGPEPRWRPLAESVQMRLADFTQMVDEVLEEAAFEPPPPVGAPAVVITPLRRAVMRAFAAAVFPGADDRRLGGGGSADPLLGEVVAVALGMPSAAGQQREEVQAMAQLLRLPEVCFSHRQQDGAELLGPSLLLQRLALQRERAGRPLERTEDARRVVPIEPHPQARPAPSAAGRLSQALSASAVEALRDCPYRFFSRTVLGLREPDELEEDAEKRDYGNWLHAVLWRFHQARGGPRTEEDDAAHLRELARQESIDSGIDVPSFLPYEASFERFVPHYVQWLQRRDREGARWLEGESDRSASPAELGGVVLRGRIDRVDRLAAPGARQLIDYKTGSAQGLRDRVRDPSEDTQLAFYAALELLHEDAPAGEELQAMYLALDDSGGIQEVPHPEVAATAAMLVQSLADELRRLRGGAPFLALGEGAVCDYCEARGLCRRDHWPDEPEQGR